jgi:hypothetical protein
MPTMQESLVALWKMDDSLPSKVVLDSSGNGYNGTAQRNTNLMHVAGKIGGALNFNGTTDYVDTGETFESTFQNSFSISGWFKTDRAINSQFILGIDSIDEMDLIFIPLTSGRETGLSHISGGVSSTGNDFGKYILNEWYFFVGVAEQTSPTTSKFYWYKNGILVNSSDGNSLDQYASFAIPKSLYIGKENTESGAGIFTGLLDDVRIYNKALSANEVKQLYNESNSDQMRLNSTGEQLFSYLGV